jgi:hypothetical protein
MEWGRVSFEELYTAALSQKKVLFSLIQEASVLELLLFHTE